jgi:hypothetical protein
MAFRSYPLPDGRVLLAGVFDESGGDSPELGPLWELQIAGEDGAVGIGHPLNSTLADLLGWNVAHEEWPEWVDRLARKIEAD